MTDGCLVVDNTGLDFCLVENEIKISTVIFNIDINSFLRFFTSELYDLNISRVKTYGLILRIELLTLRL